jgi:uncharacterized membrane protein YidH (DUF202 family)
VTSQLGDAVRRTQLAAERTWLAWLRTGIGAAVAALGVGRVAPELTGDTDWPYIVLGVGYAGVAVALLVFGVRRQRDVRRALEEGGYAALSDLWVVGLTLAAVALALVTLVLVLVGQ